ncbi:unnamed protein product, partial [Enterobius vermicularis]|uniref:Rho-GAP domain-containing protein n=1 Tax=Enterobius vermicularis TaxID=51028 RepID=A0A0N4VH00_ENTVE
KTATSKHFSKKIDDLGYNFEKNHQFTNLETLVQNLDYLLDVGYRYEIPYVVYLCEQFLISSADIKIVKKLSFAEKYKLSRLQVLLIVLFSTGVK